MALRGNQLTSHSVNVLADDTAASPSVVPLLLPSRAMPAVPAVSRTVHEGWFDPLVRTRLTIGHLHPSQLDKTNETNLTLFIASVVHYRETPASF